MPSPDDLKTELNSLSRFSDRVQDYVRYRPSYPASVIEFLREQAGLAADVTVADVGAGTGIFTRLLLDAGARVYAVEPNDAMRVAAESDLGNRAGFISVKGTAESTNLMDRSVFLVTCVQAFHWFDAAAARGEFLRILRPRGQCALIWNTSILEGKFALGYEEIKSKFGTDFQRVRHESLKNGEIFGLFFGSEGWVKHTFENAQMLDWEGLKGRLLSSSYAPKEGHSSHGPMLVALKTLFDRCQKNGIVRMEYETELYMGRLG
jgi:SAM-dependent methyltransferase